MSRKAKCIGPQDATILGIKSPREFSLRLNVFQEPFSQLKNSLNTFYQQNADDLLVPPGTSLHINDTFAILFSSTWCRAQVIGIQSNTVTLSLLDYAQKVENIEVSDLYVLDGQYLRENAYAFNCHLPGVLSTSGPVWNPAALDEMKRLVQEYGGDVQVIPVGPIQHLTDTTGCSVKSLPVEVTWTFTEAESPFSPDITKTINLAEKLHRIHFAVTSNTLMEEDPFPPYSDILDIPASATELLNEETDLYDSEGSHDISFKEDCGATSKTKISRDFRWLDPEIPGEVEFRARCTHVDDSGQIYLHLYENRSTMRIIRQVLQDKYRGTAWTAVDRMEPGQECIARYKDGLWHRGRVLDVFEDETNVLFVDYGNTKIVKNKYVRSKLFCKDNPIQAIRVVLGNVTPWSGMEKWSDHCLDFIHEILQYSQPGCNRLVLVKVIGSNKTLPLQVTIQIPPKSDPEGAWIDLGDLLVNREDAMFVDGYIEPSPELVSNWKKESKGVGYVAPGTYNNNNNNKSTSQARNPRTKPLTFSYVELFPTLKLNDISEGDVIDFELAEIASYNKIIVHPLVENSTRQLSSLADQYLEMMITLQEIADDMPPVISATDGLPVAARFHGDARGWYRGVIQQHSASKLLVQYVDYGPMTYWLDSDQVKELPQHCLAVPVAGLELTLPVDKASQDQHDDATNKMRELLCKNHDNLLTARIISLKPSLKGHIIDRNSGQPVYNRLKKEGIITFNM